MATFRLRSNVPFSQEALEAAVGGEKIGAVGPVVAVELIRIGNGSFKIEHFAKLEIVVCRIGITMEHCLKRIEKITMSGKNLSQI